MTSAFGPQLGKLKKQHKGGGHKASPTCKPTPRPFRGRRVATAKRRREGFAGEFGDSTEKSKLGAAFAGILGVPTERSETHDAIPQGKCQRFYGFNHGSTGYLPFPFLTQGSGSF